MGLLANTNSSILKVNLNHRFKIETISDNEGAGFISILEILPYEEVYTKLLMNRCLNSNEKKFYFISKSFESYIEMNDEGVLTALPSEVAKFDNRLVHSYLDPVIKLMRLFREGNICIPVKYYYFMHNNMPKSFIRQGTYLYISPEPYILESSEIRDLQRFIRKAKLVFADPSLQLAFENFELSYETHNINLSFLSLMISLEALFNPGREELRYRVSRNTAVLLGKNEKHSRKIFLEVKDLYDKRSQIVHTGESNVIKKKDLLKLRYYVRESIKEINKIGKNKGELLDLLNSSGFGQGPRSVDPFSTFHSKT